MGSREMEKYFVVTNTEDMFPDDFHFWYILSPTQEFIKGDVFYVQSHSFETEFNWGGVITYTIVFPCKGQLQNKLEITSKKYEQDASFIQLGVQEIDEREVAEYCSE